MSEKEIDPNHPWVEASRMMTPQPLPCGVELAACVLSAEDEKPLRAAMLSIIDPTGVKNVFLPIELLAYLFDEAADILQDWRNEDAEKPHIILGNDAELSAAKLADKNNRHLKGI